MARRTQQVKKELYLEIEGQTFIFSSALYSVLVIPEALYLLITIIAVSLPSLLQVNGPI